jgi:hypothetical protein
MFGLLAGGEAVVSAGNQPVQQHGQRPVAEFADPTVNPDLGMVRIMGLPVAPSMPNHGDLLACRTNANHLARLAFGVFHAINTITEVAKASSGSPIQTVVWLDAFATL